MLRFFGLKSCATMTFMILLKPHKVDFFHAGTYILKLHIYDKILDRRDQACSKRLL